MEEHDQKNMSKEKTKHSYRFGVLLAYLSSKILRCDIIMHAVKKSTREYEPLVRERVSPWYKGEGSERGET